MQSIQGTIRIRTPLNSSWRIQSAKTRNQVSQDRKKNVSGKKFEMTEKIETKDGATKTIIADVQRYQCLFCRRKFNQTAFAKHEIICKRNHEKRVFIRI